EEICESVVQMDEQREQKITQLLNSVQRDAGRDAHPSTSQSWRVKEEPSEEKWENEDELGASVKEELNETDLEFLFQDVGRIPSLDEELKKDQKKKTDNARYLDMLKFREKLPSYGMREVNVTLCDCCFWFLVISGETGCGKTTPATQFILDDFIERGMGSLCRVVCTQPMHIHMLSVAERVAAEQAESVEEGKSCGYQIRSVLYCTTGIILQWLRSDPLPFTLFFLPPQISFKHKVLDEIHERSHQSDVLLTIVKDLLTIYTLTDNCSMIHIPGYTYPFYGIFTKERIYVRPEKEQSEAEYRKSWPCFTRMLRDRYSDSTIDALEMIKAVDKINLELIVALIRHIVMKEDHGAILVFLPGWDNISTLNGILMAEQMFKSDRVLLCSWMTLASLSPQVFKKPPPGVITIDDVVYVIDGGKIKETHFDTQNNIRTMTAECVSLANTKQRKGRAGRVSPGKCYHLYNGLRASLLDSYQLPEIQRTPLEELCLQIKVFNRILSLSILHSLKSIFSHLCYSENEKLIKAVIDAGLYPKVAKIRPNHCKKRPIEYLTRDQRPFLHSESLLSLQHLYNCTEVSPFSLLFFGGDISIQRDQDQETVTVDVWIMFQSPAHTAHLVKDLREELDVLLEEKIKSPHPVVWNDRGSKDCAVLSAIIDLVTTEETPAGDRQ
uniref:RNA helicase n=1 Tax=Cyprinus carpio TaxID=7962 RepID=A0A8C1VRI8_CYPCA